MQAAIKALIVLAILFVAGRIMYQGRGKKYRFRMLHVVVNFVAVMAFNALIMVLLVGLSVVAEVAISATHPEFAVSFVNEAGGFSSDNLLVYLFALMFLTAFVHYGLRRLLSHFFGLFTLEDDEISIFEYFIQWMTIYLVVFQIAFEGIASYAATAGDVDSAAALFDVALNPQNINLAMQPLLISSWILVVLERFANQNRPKRAEEDAAHDAEVRARRQARRDARLARKRAKLQGKAEPRDEGASEK